MAHRRGLLFMLFLMLCTILFTLVMGVLIAVFQDSLDDAGVSVSAVLRSPWFIIFYQVSIFLVPLGIWLAFFREKVNMHLPHMRLGTTNIIYIIGLSIMLQPAMMVISGLTTFFFPNEVSGMVMGMFDYPYWLLILAIAVTPAICEEVVFRGYIQSAYKNKPLVTMLLINGLLFGIIHFNPQQFPYAFAMGIIFAYMVYATKSIRAGVISHFIMNASQVTLMWGMTFLAQFAEEMGEEMGIYTDTAAELDFSSPEVIIAFVFLGIIAAGATTAAGILLYYFTKHNKKRVADYEAKLEKEAEEAEESEEISVEILSETVAEISVTPENKRLNLSIDTALILVIVALYVIFVFA
jgi:membrane protease YdiL (CAAX protease family)